MIIAYLVVACFAASFATLAFTENPFFAGICGLLWPLMLLLVILQFYVSRR